MKKTGVLGAGTMGAGIIQVMAQSGYEVTFIEQKQEFIDRGMARITGALEKAVKKGRMSEEDKDAIFGRIKGSTDMADLHDAEIVVEAATENVEAKKAMFRQLDEACQENAILKNEYISSFYYGDRSSDQPSGKGDRHAFLQSGA